MRKTTRFLSWTITAAICIIVTGCAIPHNNTLVFAVHRKVGVDVTPTNATSAGLTIGFSSSEFAWVPLWANGADNKPMAQCNNKTPGPCAYNPKFVGVDRDGSGKDDDAYSVFASFGGSAAASAAADNNAELKVASFFATGIAAQNLSQADPAKLVTTNASGTKSGKSDPLRASLNAYFKATADAGSVTKECVDALGLDKDKFPDMGKDMAGRRSDLAANFVATAIKEKAPDHASKAKYQSDLLLLQFKDEKAKAETKPIPDGKSVNDVARTAICK